MNISDVYCVCLVNYDINFQVKEVYEIVKKLDPLMGVIPSILDRLLALKNLHEEGTIAHQIHFK